MADSQRRPTLADVAALSGFSKTAVSVILNDRPGSRLSTEAFQKVRAAAEELGYKPNPAAQSLRLGKTRSIGFISDEVTITRYASGMIRGVLAAARQLDHTVLIAEVASRMDDMGTAMSSMLDRRVDGIVIGLMGARLIDVPHHKQTVPMVIVNGRTTNDLPSVLPDEHSAGRAVAEELIRAGHRRVGIIGDLDDVVADPRRSVTIGLRFEGIDDALRAAGIEAVRVSVAGWSNEVGYSEARKMIHQHPDLTALIAGNDNVAFGIYQALSDLQLRVPENVAVISFDDDELAGYLRPGLTTARLPYEEMARHGVEMLLGDRPFSHDLVPMPLVRRQSVRQV